MGVPPVSARSFIGAGFFMDSAHEIRVANRYNPVKSAEELTFTLGNQSPLKTTRLVESVRHFRVLRKIYAR
jgi:hypothetical protein